LSRQQHTVPLSLLPGEHNGDHPLHTNGAAASDLGSRVHPTPAVPRVAVVGLGYVGLPTALGLFESGATVLGIDVSRDRLQAIRNGEVDVLAQDRARLQGALDEPERFILTDDEQKLRGADAVIVCVPTPVDSHLDPDLGLLRAACSAVVAHARPGQVIILASTSYPGCTREMLAAPLETRGLTPGQSICVASSPERIDPGNAAFPQRTVPRVVGGITPECTRRAATVIGLLTPTVHAVSSPEAAEMTKLIENSFRAVNIAFANEMAEVARSLGLNIGELIDAAATKPYGFMAFHPGTGVGGHCIPCDPHYLLWQLRVNRVEAPILSDAMTSIAQRPHDIVRQVAEMMSAVGRSMRDTRVLVVGVAYKPDVRDTRGSPALEILGEIADLGGRVQYHDPLVSSVSLDDQRVLMSVAKPDAAAYDVVLIHTLHREQDYTWLAEARLVVDPSGRYAAAGPRPTQQRVAAAALVDAFEIPPVADDGHGRRRRVAEGRAGFTIRG
jgi:nucleotide sugar dehydrogenase